MAEFAQISTALGMVGQTASRLMAGRNAVSAAKLTAASETNAATYNAGMEAQQGARVIGQQTATIAASGLSTKSGSPLDIILESARASSMNQQAILYGGRTRAQEALMRGYITRQTDAMQAVGGNIAGSGTILSRWWDSGGKEWWNSSASAPMAPAVGGSSWASKQQGRFTIR